MTPEELGDATTCQACGAGGPLEHLDCQDYVFGAGPFKRVRVCGRCLDALDPDVWAGRKGWESLGPRVPFADLPGVEGDGREPMPRR